MAGNVVDLYPRGDREGKGVGMVNRRVVPDTPEAKRSVITVVGSVGATLCAAAVIAAVSGISQLPSLAHEVATLSANFAAVQRDATVSERKITVLESQRASDDRTIQQIIAKAEIMAQAVDALAKEVRNAELQDQKMLVELEGRSAGRNLEAKGLYGELKSAVSSHDERFRSMSDFVRRLQEEIVALASRPASTGLPRSQPPQAPPSSFESPYVDPPTSGPTRASRQWDLVLLY